MLTQASTVVWHCRLWWSQWNKWPFEVYLEQWVSCPEYSLQPIHSSRHPTNSVRALKAERWHKYSARWWANSTTCRIYLLNGTHATAATFWQTKVSRQKRSLRNECLKDILNWHLWTVFNHRLTITYTLRVLQNVTLCRQCTYSIFTVFNSQLSTSNQLTSNKLTARQLCNMTMQNIVQHQQQDSRWKIN